MSIINKNEQPADEFKDISDNMYQFLENSLSIAFKSVYQNPKFTPQQIFDDIGTESIKTFQIASLLIQALQIADSAYVSPEVPVHVKFNKDGTVTIS